MAAFFEPLTAPPEIPGAQPLHSGKVRDLYLLDDGRLLMVASDRISAYDAVLTPEIPGKGEILTRMSLWWFDQLHHVVDNHVLSTDVPESVSGRAIICERLDMLPVECVARGYLTGSGLADYRATGAVCGIELPTGLVDGSRLPAPIFTPATKAGLGDHDENVSYERVVEEVGDEVAAELRRLALTVYGRAEELARERGIIVADTKFELGFVDGALTLCDEVLTPDSSRFWDADTWEPGTSPPSFDKQPLRDWLEESGWDKTPPPPFLPYDVVRETRERYLAAYERITGMSFAAWARAAL